MELLAVARLLTAVLMQVLVAGHCLSTSAYDHVITIDPIHGNNTERCIRGEESCKTLEWAFKEDYRKSSTIYLLERGIHVLDTSIDDFEGLHSLAIAGTTIKEALIECKGLNKGLGFKDVSHITISNLTISGCSSLRNS